MGQIPNKTYTAPDGSVYRIEADGSVTKIKDGRVQSNEPPSKYQITSDGKIYRVDEDGSVTYLGNAEDKINDTSAKNNMDTTTKKSKKSKMWLCVISALCLLVIVISMIDFSPRDNSIGSENKYMGLTENEMTYSSAETSETSEDKEVFGEVTVFRGGDKNSDDYGQMIFYPNGKCTEYIRDLEGPTICLSDYHFVSNKLYLNYEDSRTVILNFSGNTIKYGELTLVKLPASHR